MTTEKPSTDDPPLLTANGLSKRFGSTKALQGFNLSLFRGETLGLLGPNGSGKSTFLRALCGLIQLDQGQVTWLGEPLTFPHQNLRARCGTLIERPSFFPYLNAAQNLILSARYSRLNLTESESKELLERVGLPTDRRSAVSTFSQGMKQRLGLAMALVNEPELLILDEPFNGLDPIGLKTIRELLQDLAKHRGISILLSSHQLHEIEFLCDRIVLMKEGRTFRSGTLESLIGESICKYTLECSRIETAITLLSDYRHERSGDHQLTIWTRRDTVPKLIDQLTRNGVDIFHISPKQRLEDLFNSLASNAQPSFEA